MRDPEHGSFAVVAFLSCLSFVALPRGLSRPFLLWLAAGWLAGEAATGDWPVTVVSQGGRISTQQWTVDEGLPDNHVEELLRGPDGALWVGTRGGLARLLGDRVVPVGQMAPAARHLKLRFDRRGTGWISTRGGMTWTRKPVYLRDAWRERLRTETVGRALAADGQGALWVILGTQLYAADSGEPVGGEVRPPGLEETSPGLVGTRQGGVLVAGTNGEIWHGSAQGWQRRAPPPPGLDALRWCQLGEDPRGRLWMSWVSTREARGVAFHGGEGWVPMPDGILARVGLPQQFVEGPDGEWLAPTVNGQVLRLGGDWPDLESLPVVPGEAVNALVTDARGDWWLGTTRFGVRKSGRSVAGLSALGLGTRVRSLALAGGEILVGTQGSGLLVAGAAGLRRPGAPDRFPLLPETFVDTLLAGGRGLWVGMPERLEFWDAVDPGPREARARLAIRGSPLALITNAVGDVFVGGTQGQVWRIGGGDPRRGLEPLGPRLRATVAGLLVVGETLWAATEAGLRTWNGRQWEGPPVGWAGGGARCLGSTRDGWLIAGTDLGLWVQAGTNGFLWPSGVGRKLPPVNQLVEDAAGHLWLGTARGLCRLGRDDLHRIASGRSAEVPVSLQTKADGLPAQAFTYAGAALLLPDQRLAFATQDGLLVLQPGPDQPARPLPQVHITGVDLDGVPFPIEPGVGRLQPRQRHATVTVHFEVVALESPGQTQFRHRFGDLTTAWTPGGSGREVILNQPSAGRHPFQVEIKAGDGSWRPAAELVLEFPPYWWETAPARWAGGLLFISLPLGIQNSILRLRRLRRQRAQALAQALQTERDRIARDLHDHIGNRLSGIQAAAERLSLPAGESISATLLGRLRQSSIEAVAMLEEAVRTLDSSRDSSWEDLVGFLRQETAGYAEAVGLRHDFTASASGPGRVSGLHRQVLLSALRELLRNAHRHGAARNVRVSLTSPAGRLRLVVEDDGRGFAAGPALHLKRGLAGLSARVDTARGRLGIKSEPGQTRLEVEIPGEK